MYICVCNGVNDRQLDQALSEGHHCLSSLRQRLGYASSCGRCTDCLRQRIEAYRSAGGYQSQADKLQIQRAACGEG